MVDLALEPQGSDSAARLTLHLSKPDLTPLMAQAVDVAFFNREAGIEPIRLTAQSVPDGAWQIRNDSPISQTKDADDDNNKSRLSFIPGWTC